MISFNFFSKYMSKPYTRKTVLLNAVTGTGAGDTMDIECVLSQFTCVVKWGGTTPTNTVVRLEGSIDGTVWGSLAEVTVTATGTMFHIVNKPVQFIRGNYVSKSGGDATTAVTLDVVAGGN